ncbi:MAG TPA: hypothetical protein VGP48_12350 [Stellaceae bacterium]|jgi:hypothetical protein|nr:hypothetical protein [Stellaceae bacterium]
MTAAILNVMPAIVMGRRTITPSNESPRAPLREWRADPPRRRLVCHWSRDASGRLACAWHAEPPPAEADTPPPKHAPDHAA